VNVKPWYDKVTPPPISNINRVGAPNWDSFKIQADHISSSIERHITLRLDDTTDPTVLDFGAGVGRVALKLKHTLGLPTHCCDVDESAMIYLRTQLPMTDCRATAYAPPLPYSDDFFDLVYSISIWTHLPIKLQLPWLREIRRILKPGGLAMISVSGAKALQARKKLGLQQWMAIGEEDLALEGIIFRPYEHQKTNPEAYPGVTDEYGLTLHHPEWIRNHWSDVLSIDEILIDEIDNIQDLVIMSNR